MGYPRSIFEFEDQTVKVAVPSTGSADTKPIIMTVSSSDKGSEDFCLIKDEKEYTAKFGDISFAKHGQAQVQIPRILRAGGECFHKRVVAKDSTLSHIGYTVKVSKSETQKMNAEGALLYTDADGNETTEADGNTPIMISNAVLKYGTAAITDTTALKNAGNDPKELARLIKANYDISSAGDEKEYLLWVFTDTGRGAGGKRVIINPDYSASKSSKYTKYMITVLEGTASTDKVMVFSMNTDMIDNDENKSIQNVVSKRSQQIRCVMCEDMINAFISDVAGITGLSIDYIKEHDILFGCTRKGVTIPTVKIDSAGISLNNALGVELIGGSNGSFGTNPIDTEDLMTAVEEVFNGTASDEIYDLNNRRINAIFDANWPAEVKRSIEGLTEFREDTMYFRDLGLGLKTVDEILSADASSLKSMFCATYHNSYDVYDDYTYRQITVTCMYDLCALYINHEREGVNRPFAGQKYNVVFDNAIAGTVNFIPKKVPAGDWPQVLYDANINYCVIYDGVLTMETERTSQEKDSDFSYVNNVLAVQDVIRLVRRRCPKIRYSFTTGDDFEKYQKDVNAVLAQRTGFFESLTLEYLADKAQEDSKCYYAAIKVACKDFVENEYFKVIAI